jgi:nucleotide-binding universal stress UspA family protein
MKILIGVDGSDNSNDAVRQAGWLLSPARDEVGFYYSPPKVEFNEPKTHGPELIERAHRALGDAVFDEARQRLPAEVRSRVHTILGAQSPNYGLIAAADEWRADLLVLGASSHTGAALGGTARAVARSATVPVLVTRPRPPAQAAEPWRVLLAFDESEAGRRAAKALHYPSWPPDTEGYILTVVESFLPGEVPPWLEARARDADSEAMAQMWIREHETEKQATRDRLAAFSQQLPAVFHAQEPIVVEGHPAEQILRAVPARRINLVVVGAQGKNAWQRLLIGSTSEAVLEQAPCSVLVVRRRERP